MPTVLRIGPYRVYFYSHEQNEPEHVHVDRGRHPLSSGLIPLYWPGALDSAQRSCVALNGC